MSLNGVIGIRVGPVVMARFLVEPTPATDRLINALTDEAFGETGEPITFVAVLPHAAVAGVELFRERLVARSRREPRTAAVHLVLEGDDPGAEERRSAIAALPAAEGFSVHVHSRAERSLIAAAAQRSLDASELFAAAQAAGVLPQR